MGTARLLVLSARWGGCILGRNLPPSVLMRVIHLSLLICLCVRFAGSLPVEHGISEGTGLLDPAIDGVGRDDHVLQLLEDAAIVRPAGEETLTTPTPLLVNSSVEDREDRQAVPSNALDDTRSEDAKLDTSPLSIGHADPQDEPAHGVNAVVAGLLTQIQTGLRQLQKQALAMAKSSSSSGSTGLVIGVAVGGVFVCFCLGCLISRWWWRTPNVKQGWRHHASQQRVQNRKHPGSVVLHGGNAPSGQARWSSLRPIDPGSPSGPLPPSADTTAEVASPILY